MYDIENMYGIIYKKIEVLIMVKRRLSFCCLLEQKALTTSESILSIKRMQRIIRTTKSPDEKLY